MKFLLVLYPPPMPSQRHIKRHSRKKLMTMAAGPFSALIAPAIALLLATISCSNASGGISSRPLQETGSEADAPQTESGSEIAARIAPGSGALTQEAFHRQNPNFREVTYCEIPAGYTELGYGVFSNCVKLKTVVIPNTVTKIGHSAFFACTSLETIEIPNSVTLIDQVAFYFCVSLESITIPESVTTIDHQAFYNCTKLKEVSLADGVLLIGSYAFSGCMSLPKISIPQSVLLIGNDAFYGCWNLEEVEFEKTTGWIPCNMVGSNLIPVYRLDYSISDNAKSNANNLKTTLSEFYIYRLEQ